MKTLESIHLRLAGPSPQSLVETIKKAVRSCSDPMEARIYRHTRLQTDLIVHLHREAVEGSGSASDVGIRLASLLRGYGMVEHSVWTEHTGTGEE